MARPDWLERLLTGSKRHNVEDFGLVDELYKAAQAIKFDMFDERSFQEIQEESLDLKDLTWKRKLDDPPWPDLIQDAYLALWKARPKIRNADEMRPSHLLNQMTMDRLMDVGDYQRLRTWTIQDDWSSAMGTLALALKLEDLYDEQKDLAETRQELFEQEQELLRQLAQMEADAEAGMTDEEIDAALDALIEGLTEYGQGIAKQEEQLDGARLPIRVAVATALEAALEQAEETESMISYFGTDPGQWTKLDPRKRLELARRLNGNKKLQEIARLLGRMKRMAVGQWTRRIVHGTDEVYDVVTGRDLTKMLPSDLLYLADDELAPIFYNKYVEGSLLNYDLRGTEKVAQGAIVCLLDNSGSMEGDREVWGKTVALSLLDIAKREHRDFYGIHFGSPGEWKEWFFPKGVCEIENVLDYAATFFRSGTDFATPIGRAIEILTEQFTEAGSVRGDIIMITDGECRVSNEWLTAYFEAKDLLNFKLYGMLIGWDAATLETLADKMYRIEDLMKGDDIQEVFTLV